MSLIPQNKGIALVALGAALIITCLSQKWDVAQYIILGFFALINPAE